MSYLLRAALRASAAALALGLSMPAVADEVALDDAEPVIVVTASRVGAETVPTVRQAQTEIERVPGGVNVVDSDQFSSRFAASLRDALAFSPGVFAQSRYGEEVRLSIRGSSPSPGEASSPPSSLTNSA